MPSLRKSLGVALLFAVAAITMLASAHAAAEKSAESGGDLFTGTNVVRIQIEIPPEGMTTLGRYQWQWGGGNQERESVKGIVREGGRVYRDVAIHLKGAAGSFRPIGSKPALTLNFDKFVKDQTFHGLDKISLNNSVQDSTYLNEKICRELFAAAGVPVPRADHAIVELNGHKLGLYVLVEGFNKQFLKQHFKSAKGNLYDGGFVKDVDDGLALSSGGDPKDRADLKALAAAARAPVSSRWTRLEQILDMDRFISMIAMEIMQCHWDGYALNKNNYRIYHDPDSNKLVFMPHGLDQMFAVNRVETSMPILPGMQGFVASAVLQTPEGRRRYLERTSQLLTNVFKVEAITNRVNELAAKIRPLTSERNSPVADFCRRIAERAASIKQQLGQQLVMVSSQAKFDAAGALKPAGWKSKADFGKPALNEMKMNGGTVLRASAEQGSSVGSWQTKVILESGRYRLEGRVKTQGVAPDAGDKRGGAGFRIGTRRQFVTGTTEWTNLGCDFEVQEALGEVELFCELRAAKGEAWFDADSLKLIRK